MEQPASESENVTDFEEDMIFNITSKTTPSYRVVVEIDEQPIPMEIDTGAAVSVISQEVGRPDLENYH